MTISINLAGGTPRWAGVISEYDDINRKLRNANGVRFKVLGDGRKWRVHFTTSNVTDSAFHGTTITTQSGRVSNIDISYSKLRQPDWGTMIRFNKNNITGISIERQHDLGGTGSSTIKIFDFEIY
jgi:hypothetical protein